MRTRTTAEIRELETRTIASGISGFTLMTRAGRIAAELINARSGNCRRIVFLCGGGNNGGDALVAAASVRLPAVVYALRPASALKGEARQAAEQLPGNIPYLVRETFSPADFRPGDLIVDGLLGIGFAGGRLRPAAAAAIAAANASHCPIWALDLPSGLAADTGEGSPDGVIQATGTITFGALKAGLFRGAGPVCRGELHVADIGFLSLPQESGDEVFTAAEACALFPRPDALCHKNSRGRVLVVSGSRLYPGAAALAAESALKSGAGIVRLVTTVPDFPTALPHALITRFLPAGPGGALPEDTFDRILDFSGQSDVLAAGCGWGDAPLRLLEDALYFPGPVVLDADALNLAARHPECWKERDQLILTPHPGEAGRLCKALGIAEYAERDQLAAALAARLHAVVLLKGRDTVVAAPDGRVSRNASGSAALATAGSGDVLTGIIAALCAAGCSPWDAARLGAFWHGCAGERGCVGMTADDLAALLPETRQLLSQNLY